MPKVAEEHLAARREQIIQAAFACFSRRGFPRTTMQDICTEAALSPGAVYRYFASKEAIIIASCQMEQERTHALFSLAEAATGTRDALAHLVEAFFGEVERPDAAEFIRAQVNVWAEGVVNPPVGVQQLCSQDEAVAFLAGLARRAQAAGEFDPSLDPEAIARVMVSLYNGLLLQKAFDPQVDASSYAQVALAMLTGRLWRERGA